MKNMILNFRSAYLKLLCLSAFYVLFLIRESNAIELTISFESDSSESKFSDYTFYDSSNRRVVLNRASKYFIVLKNNRNCIDCFKSINDFVQDLKKKVNAEFVFISMIDSTTLDRKRNLYSNRELMPGFDNYYFQYEDSPFNLFDKPENVYTPEIILIKSDKILRITYPNIFEYRSMNLNEQTQLEIVDFLK